MRGYCDGLADCGKGVTRHGEAIAVAPQAIPSLSNLSRQDELVRPVNHIKITQRHRQESQPWHHINFKVTQCYSCGYYRLLVSYRTARRYLTSCVAYPAATANAAGHSILHTSPAAWPTLRSRHTMLLVEATPRTRRESKDIARFQLPRCYLSYRRPQHHETGPGGNLGKVPLPRLLNTPMMPNPT